VMCKRDVNYGNRRLKRWTHNYWRYKTTAAACGNI